MGKESKADRQELRNLVERIPEQNLSCARKVLEALAQSPSDADERAPDSQSQLLVGRPGSNARMILTVTPGEQEATIQRGHPNEPAAIDTSSDEP
jgi:hypothetical protein